MAVHQHFGTDVNTRSVFALQACLQAAHFSMALYLRYQLNAKDPDIEQALLLCYVTTKVLVKCRLGICWTNHTHTLCYKDKLTYFWEVKAGTYLCRPILFLPRFEDPNGITHCKACDECLAVWAEFDLGSMVILNISTNTSERNRKQVQMH